MENNIQKRLNALRKIIISEGIVVKNWEKIRNEFTDIWDAKRIQNMTLEEYTDTKREYSFTYWIENVLSDFGNIRGSTAIKFGIYLGSDGVYKYKKSLLNSDILDNNSEELEEYVKNNKNNIEQEDKEDVLRAFYVVRKTIEKIISCSQNGNLEKGKKGGLADLFYIGEISLMFKWKIAFLYNFTEKENKKENRNEILPIYSWDKLLEISEINNLKLEDNDSYPEIYKGLIDKKTENENLLDYAWNLLGSLEDDNRKEAFASIYQISQSARQNAYILNKVKFDSYYEYEVSLFAWNIDKFKNIDNGDIVFFVNPAEDIQEGEFSLLVTRKIDNVIMKIVKDEEGKNDTKNIFFHKKENKEDSIDYMIKPYKELKMTGKEQNSINDFDNKEFVIFEVIGEYKDEFKDWKNVGAGQITYIKDWGNKRFGKIIEYIKYKKKELKICKTTEKLLEGFDIKTLKGDYLSGRFYNVALSNEQEDFEKLLLTIQDDKELIFILQLMYDKNENQKIGLKTILVNVLKENFNNYESTGGFNKKDLNGIKDFDQWMIDIYGLKIINIENILRNFRLNYNNKTFKNFLKSGEFFDYKYLQQIIKNLKEVIDGSFGEHQEKDQKGESIGILGKWGEGKTTIIEEIKELYKEEKTIYEIDVWKGYASIGNRGGDKIGLIKYFFSQIISKYEKKNNKKEGFFSDIRFLKNNLYNDILIEKQYVFNKWIKLGALITAIYMILQSFWLSFSITILGIKFENSIIQFISQFLYGISIFLLIFYFIYLFIRQLLKFSYVTSIFKRQITELNLANEFKIEIEKNIFSKEGEKNIIILENIDRLQGNQILEVLDLTKTILEFKNTTYIIPIDQYLITEGLKSRYTYIKEGDIFDPIDYIDKIINYPMFIINPYIEKLQDKKEDIFKNTKNSKNVENSENSENIELDYSKYGFSDKFIRSVVAKYNPRKETIFRRILQVYINIYKEGLDFYKEDSFSRYEHREIQKLFLCFLSLRYTNFVLYRKVENNMGIIKNFISFKIGNEKDLTQKIGIFEGEIKILTKIFENFYPNNEYNIIQCLSEDELYQYTRRVYVSLSKETEDKINEIS